jgi:hypothetical protein
MLLFHLAWVFLQYPLQKYLLHVVLSCLRKTYLRDLTVKYEKNFQTTRRTQHRINTRY